MNSETVGLDPLDGVDRSNRDSLVRAHVHLVRNIAFRLRPKLPASYDIDDLIGVGQLALLSAAESFRPDLFVGVPFGAYARYRIRGAMLDTARRKKLLANTRPSMDDVPEPHVCPELDEAIDRARLIFRLREAMAQLPDRERRIMELHLAGERFATIAGMLGVSESRICQLHARALDRLRVAFGFPERRVGYSFHNRKEPGREVFAVILGIAA